MNSAALQMIEVLRVSWATLGASAFDPDRRVLKFPSWLPGWWRSFPPQLPGESSQERSRDETQRAPGKPGILEGGFRESKAVQLRIGFNRLHAAVIPPTETPSVPDSVRDIASWSDERKAI